MPSGEAWATWAAETMGRLEESEPLTPKQKVRKNKAGRLEILAWQGEPVAEVQIRPGGELRLQAVSIGAFQIMETPRSLDGDGRPDAEPAEDLREMFHRVRASLTVWMRALEHLKVKPRIRPTSHRHH